jgi:hypothetical protein
MVIANAPHAVDEASAMALYKGFLGNPPVYELYKEVTIGDITYWHWFSGSYESEGPITFITETDPFYYVQIVNEETTQSGFFRIEAFCW